MTVINSGVFGEWEVLAPPGMTDAGRIHRFQERTVSRLAAAARVISDETFATLRSQVAATYREGDDTIYNSLQHHVTSTRTGVRVEFRAGGRHLQYLTRLVGLQSISPGHTIPRNGRIRFYWKNPLHGLPAGMYFFSSRNPVQWKPRLGRGDVIGDVLGAGAQRFVQTMIREHETALIQFVQNDLAPVTRSPRVKVAGR